MVAPMRAITRAAWPAAGRPQDGHGAGPATGAPQTGQGDQAGPDGFMRASWPIRAVR
jgi:hypothetical protein